MENFKPIQDKHAVKASGGQSAQAQSQSEVKHHFVAYVVNANNELIELDGTKTGPLVIKKDVKKEDLIVSVGAEMQRKLADGEISDKLSLMVIGPPAE